MGAGRTTWSDVEMRGNVHEEALEVLDEAHESHDKSPADHDGGNPDGRPKKLESHVGRDLGSLVEHERN